MTKLFYSIFYYPKYNLRLYLKCMIEKTNMPKIDDFVLKVKFSIFKNTVHINKYLIYFIIDYF